MASASRPARPARAPRAASTPDAAPVGGGDAAGVAETSLGTPAAVVARQPSPTRAERAAHGKAERARVPLEAHAELVTAERPDPVALLMSQDASRVPELLPIRYGRMSASPFTFYRGAALVMATDLAATPTTTLTTQLCGDAHLSNFGVYASPERRLVFDLNDFDETYPGPFEWDVKRLAASLAVAARENGWSTKRQRACARAAVASYRTSMLDAAAAPTLEVWYRHIDVEALVPLIKDSLGKGPSRRTREALAKARGRDSRQAWSKLVTQASGHPQIVSDPPLLVPIEELFGGVATAVLYEGLGSLLRSYRRSLQSDRRHLMEQFTLVHAARKVVGVGSVGTRAWVLLFEGVDTGDPLVLQAKEAQRSVVAGLVRGPKFTNEGRRVVAGQHLMQAVSDIFLGWQRVADPMVGERDFYVRQLRDGKGSVVVEGLAPAGLELYAQLCGAALARAHARAGDRVAIAAYLGRSTRFEDAVAQFSLDYAALTDTDHALLTAAIGDGRVTATPGI